MIALRFTRLATLAWACALVAGSAPSALAGIVYTMTNASGIQNGWELSGTINAVGVARNPYAFTPAPASFEVNVRVSTPSVTVHAQFVIAFDPRPVPVLETVIVPDSSQPF